MFKFNSLDHAVVLQVVGKAIREFQDELAGKKVTLEVTPGCMEWLAEKGYSRDFGAREIARLVSSKLKDFFVDEILFGRLSKGGSARAGRAHHRTVSAVAAWSLARYSGRGISTAPIETRCGVRNCTSNSAKPAVRSRSSIAARAIFEAFSSSENIDSPAKNPPIETP